MQCSQVLRTFLPPWHESESVKDEDEIDDDEDRTLKIDEGPLTNLTQIAQEANWNRTYPDNNTLTLWHQASKANFTNSNYAQINLDLKIFAFDNFDERGIPFTFISNWGIIHY